MYYNVCCKYFSIFPILTKIFRLSFEIKNPFGLNLVNKNKEKNHSRIIQNATDPQKKNATVHVGPQSPIKSST